MTEDSGDIPCEDPDELRREIREQGARIAYTALLDVCRDPKAPAPAKATAGTTILRVGGYLERVEAKDEDALARLSDTELAKLTNDLRAQVAAVEGAQSAGAKRPGASPKRSRAAGAPKPKRPVGLFD